MLDGRSSAGDAVSGADTSESMADEFTMSTECSVYEIEKEMK